MWLGVAFAGYKATLSGAVASEVLLRTNARQMVSRRAPANHDLTKAVK